MKKRILLIEDNPDIRENTAEILELDNYEVLTAENGKVGVEKATKEKPDIIICDIMMPELDGYGVLHMLTKNPETADIPFIFLTAKADRTDFRKGMEMGADDYLTKPFDDIELLNAIESRFRKQDVINKKYENTLAGLDGMIRDIGGEEELQNLRSNRKQKSFKKKTEIYREGDYPNYLYFLESGKVKTFKTNDDGKELIVKLFGPGEFFGYNNLINEGNYTDSAAAMEACEISLIPKTEFHDLLFKNKQVAQKFIGMLTQDIKENEDQLIKLAYNSVRKRVSESLLKFREKQADPSALLKVTREDLSNVAGTSLETAIRTLSDFKEEGLIDITGGKIRFLNIQKLESLRN
ncbi:cAMP-binding domain of CRP or a regulatory subunit of cAMP-dependent protein kinases [Spirosomataceae bacterium TFI 002]|nr:cAMP-binding domain of CRP or a regulatory subunit of cAMP-dependent protein kinases [Spirosomataceae bacterium TFI 002]